jgi:hypothetical protein
MRSPLRLAGLLDRRLSAWRTIMLNRYQVPFYDDEDAKQSLAESLDFDLNMTSRTPHTFEEVDADEITLGEVLTVRGRLLDLLEFIENCWPARKAWCDQRRLRNSLIGFHAYPWYETLRVPHFQDRLLIGDLTRLPGVSVPAPHFQDRLLIGGLTPSADSSERDHVDEENSIPELEILYAYHDAKVRLRALLEMDAPSFVRNETIDQIAFSATERYQTLDKTKLEWLFREYIFNERLFLWSQSETSSSRPIRYRFIYELANVNTTSLNDSIHRNLQDAVRTLALEGPDIEDILQIVIRVGSYIQCFGYEHFAQDVTQDGGQWGPSSGIGSQEPVNLVPSGGSTVCHRIVLGLASGRNNRSRRSLQNVLEDVLGLLRRCEPTTKSAIVITDLWDKDIIVEYVNDISLCKQQGKSFLFLLVNGRKLIPMDFSFS